MRRGILAVGRARSGPEAELTRDYLARADAAGRPLGLGPVALTEIDERKARAPEAQADRLLEHMPDRGIAIALDERGATLDSPGLAALLARERDAGRPAALFLIGGAEGHGDRVRAEAHRLLSLGPMIWPHLLVRAMVAEQIYRAVTILAGSRYHRG